MVNTDTKEMVGVECPVCHDEAFQLVKREATIVTKCCPRCAARIDYEQEDQTIKDATKAMEKKDHLYFLKDKSFEWADKLHGKKVIVYWDDNTHPTLITHYESHVCGTAYRTTNECGGWGRVKVIIDPAEHHRITPGCLYTLYCEIVERDMFFAPASILCSITQCRHRRLIIDGRRWGLPLGTENGDYYALVSWGCRKTIVIDEKGDSDGRKFN